MGQVRITRVPFEVDLLREMDQAVIAEIGGYRTRNELIVDAVRERLLELRFEEAPPPAQRASATDRRAKNHQALDLDRTPAPVPSGAAEVVGVPALRVVQSSALLEPAQNLSRQQGYSLFGLHNRDYPTLWVLAELAEMCQSGPISLSDFWRDIMRRAWKHGELLTDLESRSGRKATALFPTNPAKAKAAETGFRSFAVGDIVSQAEEGVIHTGGPLFEWQAAGLTRLDGKIHIGVTTAGWDLLMACSGLSVVEPHSEVSALRFLEHLASYAAEDHRVLREVLAVVASDSASRKDVLAHLAGFRSDWTSSQVSTNASGYIARAREWGLVEPKQVEGTYELTALGRRIVNTPMINEADGENL